MRASLLVALVVLLTAAAGVAICRLVRWTVDWRALSVAAAGAIAAGELALAPVLLSRGADQPTMAQVGLIGTAVHLLASVAVLAVVVLGRLTGFSFVYWMLAFYWVVLIVLATVLVRLIRRAPVAARK